MLIYDPEFDEIGVHVHSRTVGEQKLYLAAIGRHLFKDERYFPPDERFTLDPLVERGAAALACADVQSLEAIKLIEYQRYWGGQFKESEVRRASDIFAALGERRFSYLARGELKRAVFSVMLRGETKSAEGYRPDAEHRDLRPRRTRTAIWSSSGCATRDSIIPSADEQNATADAALDSLGDDPWVNSGAAGVAAAT